MAKNEKKANVKEKTTASIEFSDIKGADTNGTYGINVIPTKLDMNGAITSIDIDIHYVSNGKIAHIEETYLGTYEIIAIIHAVLSFSTGSFIKAMQNGNASVEQLNNRSFMVNGVDVLEVNPINVNKQDPVGVDVIKARAEQKFMRTSDAILKGSEISIAILQKEYEVENK